MQLGVTITAVSASPNPVIRLSLIRPITARQSRHNNHHFGNHKQLSVRPHTDHCPLLVVDIHLIHVHQDIHLPLYGCPKCCVHCCCGRHEIDIDFITPMAAVA